MTSTIYTIDRAKDTPFIVSETDSALSFSKVIIDEFLNKKQQLDPTFTLEKRFVNITMRDLYRSDQVLIDILFGRGMLKVPDEYLVKSKGNEGIKYENEEDQPYSLEVVKTEYLEYTTVVDGGQFEYITINIVRYKLDSINRIANSADSDSVKLKNIQSILSL